LIHSDIVAVTRPPSFCWRVMSGSCHEDRSTTTCSRPT